jgi:hypothetical protein
VAIADVSRTEATATERPEPRDPGAERAFLRWSVGIQLGVTTVMVVAIVAWVGHFTYTLDDAAIHLSVADRLARDGTWGVVAGDFQSASSSPLWTVLLAAGTLVSGPAVEWVPLVLNVAAGVGVLWVLAQAQRAVRPGRGRPLDLAATVLLVVAALFLPGLAVVGMEHTLHTALVLAVVLGVHRWVLDEGGPGPAAVAALVALATLTRFETAFVAVGLALALLVVDRRRWFGRAVGLLAASAVPIAAFAAVNRAMGGGWLPNSLLAKGNGPGAMQRDGLSATVVVDRATSDPLLFAFVTAALVYLVMRGRRGPAFVPACTLVVAAAAYSALADMGWYQRYQAYLIAIGVYAVLVFLADLPRATARRALMALCVVMLVTGVTKLRLTVVAPLAADDIYLHHYQAATFLERYYDGVPVATDQLGYISLFHEGPLTDFAGLGDYEVLERYPHETARELRRDLAIERGFEVVVISDRLRDTLPEDWIEVGRWDIDIDTANGAGRPFVFFAVGPDRVAPLQEALTDFEPRMRARSELVLNEQAAFQAMAIDAREAAEGDPPP